MGEGRLIQITPQLRILVASNPSTQAKVLTPLLSSAAGLICHWLCASHGKKRIHSRPDDTRRVAPGILR
jgi:hypothetical protein